MLAILQLYYQKLVFKRLKCATCSKQFKKRIMLETVYFVSKAKETSMAVRIHHGSMAFDLPNIYSY